jgi:UDP-N-acetylmuramoyl-L-alanyl-D-glutamate--2,6-diaminopimelate ligase
MAALFGHPSEKLNLVGITGTNGKTTIASLLYQLFKSRFKVGLISTVKIVDNIEYKATHTTPDSITINHYLAEMRCRVEYCFMEVSSHGFIKRTEALHFVGGFLPICLMIIWIIIPLRRI